MELITRVSYFSLLHTTRRQLLYVLMRIGTSLTKQSGSSSGQQRSNFYFYQRPPALGALSLAVIKLSASFRHHPFFFFFWCWARENSRSTVPAASRPSGTNPPERNRLSKILVRFSFMRRCLVTLATHLMNSVKIYRFKAIKISSFDSTALIRELKYKHVVVLLCYFPIQAPALHLLWNK